MDLLEPRNNPLLVNLAFFVVSAAIVWLAGSHLARCAKAIADHTGAGQALLGAVLLGAVASLPELAMAAAAAVNGDAALAVGILLGGIAMTMAALAAADATTRHREPLSTDVTKPVVILQGVMVIGLLSVTAGGIALEDIAIPGLGVGVWTTALLVLYVVCIAAIGHSEERKPWVPTRPARHGDKAAGDKNREPGHPGEASRREADQAGEKGWPALSLARCSLPAVLWHTAAASAIVLAAGVLSAGTAGALAEQTGLGAGFFGFVFGGAITTLPELSTMIAAARLRQYEMTFADAFGTNLFSLALLFLVDLLYPGAPVFSEVGLFALFATLLGIALTAAYMVGLVLRSRRNVLRMGYDSIAVLVLSAAGVGILYTLR